MSIQPSTRLSKIPPYLFAELERKIAAKKAAGVDVISLGIGDPDYPTYQPIVETMQQVVTDPTTHQYPSNRGRSEFRAAIAEFYDRRFDVTLDPDTEILPAIGAKECIFNLNLAYLDRGDIALAADPGYPVYTGGPTIVDAQYELMPLLPELGFIPDLTAIDPAIAKRAKLLYINYPNNPTGAVVPDGFFEQIVEFAQQHNILVVHDNAYSEITFDGYRAPSFLATPGAKEVGVEVFSLSKGYNMTGWRCAAIAGNQAAINAYWQLKTNIDSGLFDAVQLAGARALQPDIDTYVANMNMIYKRRRDAICAALQQSGVDVTPPRGTIYIWAPIPASYGSSAEYCEHVLEATGVVISPGGAYGQSGEGFFRISLTTPDERLMEAVARLETLVPA